ncbi:MAG: hypothetical protein ACR2QK_03115, partial [Acidimicrobiales bacterium]
MQRLLGSFRSSPPARRLVVLAALLLLASACSDGSSSSDGDLTAGAVLDGGTAVEDPPTTDDPTSPDDQVTDTTDTDATAATGDDGHDGTSDVEAVPGLCTIEEINRHRFYAVANIADDDPDGGLNVRDDYQDGARVATLPEGSVVVAADCYLKDDGAVWYSVETDDVAGWVNSAYLSPDIPALQPTFHGAETTAKVEAVLDALAAADWPRAAAALTLSDSVYQPVAELLDEGDDLAAQLEAYCRRRICDGPYTIAEVRGSYVPSRVPAEVDVAFTYPGGVVIETFERVSVDSEFTIDSLPGRSVLAERGGSLPVSELIEAPVADDAELYAAAAEIRRALLSEAGPRIPDEYMPLE